MIRISRAQAEREAKCVVGAGVPGSFAAPDRSDVATDCGLCRPGRALEIVADLIGAPVAELRAERTIIEVVA